MKTIAIYIGDSLPPNLLRLLSGLGEVVADRFRFVLLGTNLETTQIPSRYEYQDVGGNPSERGITELIETYRRVESYLAEVSSRPDAVWQLTAPHFHAVPVLLAARRHDVAVATRIPGNKFDEFRKASGIEAAKLFAINNIALRALRYSTLVVTLSEHNKRNLIARGVPSRKIRVLRPPLNTNQFTTFDPNRKQTLQTELGFNSTTQSVLYVGRLSELKGMADLEEVVAAYSETNAYEFHFVGTGEFSDQLEQYSNTTLHGFVDPDKLHQYYKATDLLVHPSYVEEEGISWTMLEAAATGLPVVARDKENAADIASFVFNETEELIAYLSEPTQWEPAKYPTKWSLDHCRSEYNEFFDTLTTITE